MKTLLTIVITAVAIVGGAFGVNHFALQPTVQPQSYGNFNPTGGGTYYLQASINSTQNTVTLTSFTEPSSNIPYTMSYLNSSIEYGTINPNSPTSEFISFTGITQNANGTALLTGVVRGLGRSYPYTASTTLAHSVPGQTQFILSSPPQFFNQYYVLANVSTSSNILNFGSTTPPRYDADPVWANFSTQVLADVSYVNSVVAAGAANASETVKGIVQLATAAQAALGTSAGSTGARLGIPNSLATSTPGLSTITGDIPTATGRFIAQAWIDLSQAFVFTGSITIPGTVANPLTLNTLPYSFQTTRAASSTVLSEDGSGHLNFEPLNFTLPFAGTNGPINIGTTASASTTLVTAKIPANTFTSTRGIDIGVTFGNTGPQFNGVCGYDVQIGSGSASTSLGSFTTSSNAGTNPGIFTGTLYATSTTGEYGYFETHRSTVNNGPNLIITPQIMAMFTYATYTNSNATYLALVAKTDGAGETCSVLGASIRLITQ